MSQHRIFNRGPQQRIVNFGQQVFQPISQQQTPKSVLAQLLLLRGSRARDNTRGAGIRSAGESILGALLQKSAFAENQQALEGQTAATGDFIRQAFPDEGFGVSRNKFTEAEQPFATGNALRIPQEGITPEQTQASGVRANQLGQALLAGNEALGQQGGIGIPSVLKLLQNQIKGEQEFQDRETFRPVFDENGNIVAQKSSLTGKVIKDPRGAGETTGRARFAKGPPLIVEGVDAEGKGTGKFFQSILQQNNQTGEVEEKQVPVTGRPVDRLGEGAQAKRDANVESAVSELTKKQEVLKKTIGDIEFNKNFAGKKGSAKAAALELDIITGDRDAKAMIIVRRNLDILDTLKTGGFAGAQIKFKAAFGIENADEAELMRNMGIAVLQQIRPIFGAQPSKDEGFLLIRLEAGLGKSTPGNRRLLRQALKILDRSSKVGIGAATEARDFRRAQNIQDSLDFDLSKGLEQEPRTTPSPLSDDVNAPVSKEFSKDLLDLTDEEFIQKYLSDR